MDDRTFDVAAVRLGREGSSVVLVILKPPAEARICHAFAATRRDERGSRSSRSAAWADPAAPVADAAAAFMSLGEVKPAATRTEPLAERRHPLRFVWHLDEDDRFAVASDEFAQLVGPRTARVDGTWSAIAATLTLDPNDQVKRALASRETWSGIVVSWPVDDSDKRLPIELSGLPVFDRDRTFRGYRGFGVCRDVDHINALVRVRREARKDTVSSSEAPSPAPRNATTRPQPRQRRPLKKPARSSRQNQTKPLRRRMSRRRPKSLPCPKIWRMSCRFALRRRWSRKPRQASARSNARRFAILRKN